ncbi:MAG TPA: acyloxyacyl hydrolase [Burkholderiales bacterium]|nr:acyloxyacyl hydrolase [Burkholderiales bacterium]
MRRLIAALLLALPLVSNAADPQWIAAFGRGAESADADVLRLAYRHPLPESERWWMPTHAQLGASVWRVPDIRGTTRRFDLNATAIWRAERGWGYYEAGFGGYLLSKTINNDDTRVPSAFEFGSHVGIGFRLAKNHTLGIGLQHLSNAGIKQPNGGIDLLLVQYTVSVR